ncbi:hypothetical protein T12_265 [Trichinella patagoniensis]|uniref:Uncharacterized protein n=1 Tax=Trichinella patagoniensis TaxID=990121 RepID=A0A0V0Z5N4_9BILA|nr:hypothetical protein T12_265 [Trichinella patagoniensis]
MDHIEYYLTRRSCKVSRMRKNQFKRMCIESKIRIIVRQRTPKLCPLSRVNNGNSTCSPMNFMQIYMCAMHLLFRHKLQGLLANENGSLWFRIADK